MHLGLVKSTNFFQIVGGIIVFFSGKISSDFNVERWPSTSMPKK